MFKAGDVVVLEEGQYYSDFMNILAKENHLFEVTGRSHRVLILRSLSTDIKESIRIERVRHASLKGE